MGRRDEIVSRAGQLFLVRGYQGTTIDEIARQLGMSKHTVYSRFPDKEALFSAVIEAKCHQYIPHDLFASLEGVSTREFLLGVALGLSRLLVSDDATKMERLIMTEGPHRTRLAQIFFEAGPARVKRLISAELARYSERGELVLPHPEVATDLFTALIRGSDLCMRRMILGTPPPNERAVRLHAEAVVDLFLRAYGTHT